MDDLKLTPLASKGLAELRGVFGPDDYRLIRAIALALASALAAAAARDAPLVYASDVEDAERIVHLRDEAERKEAGNG